MSAYQAVNALADTVIDNVRYVTEFSRNFMRLEHSLNETQVRPRVYGVPYPSYSYCPMPPYAMTPRILYPMPMPTYPVPSMYSPHPYYAQIPYPPPQTFQPSMPMQSIPVTYPYPTEANYPTTVADTPPSGSSNWSPVDDPIVPPENEISCARQEPPQSTWAPPPAYYPTAIPMAYPPPPRGPMPQGMYAYPSHLYHSTPPPHPALGAYFPSPYPYHTPSDEN